ncbi:MAG: ROK family protein [Thomasclavelia ramosa]
MLADIAHTVDPHCFVLGGGVMKSKKYFYDQLVEQFNCKNPCWYERTYSCY